MCFHSQLPSYLRPPSRPQASAFPLMKSQGDGFPGRTSSSLPLAGSAVLNDTPVACQIRGPTDPQGDRCPRRGRMRRRRAAAQVHYLSPTGIVSRPGASVSFVSDGPISSNSGRNGGKNAGRNCVSALPQRATVGCDFPHLLAGITFCHRCRSKGLCLRSPARRLTRPLASATAGVFRSYRHPPKPSPLMGPCC